MIKLARSFKSNRTAVGVALLATMAILAAGCSSSSSGSSATTTTSKPAASATTTTATSSSSTTTTTAAASTTTTTSAAALGSTLLAKFESGEHATFLATYKITSGATKELTSLTIGQQSPDQIFKGTTASGAFELLTLGTKGYLCSQSGGAGWTCFDETAANPDAELFALYEPAKYLPYFQAAASAAGAHTSYSSMSVGGFPLSCITVSGAPNENGSGTFCVTAQGVLGYVSWTGAAVSDSGSFEISSFSTSVPAGEFNLPATPTAIPTA
jgi:hypothetical protein